MNSAGGPTEPNGGAAGWGDKWVRFSGSIGVFLAALALIFFVYLTDSRRSSEHTVVLVAVTTMHQSIECSNLLNYLRLMDARAREQLLAGMSGALDGPCRVVGEALRLLQQRTPPGPRAW